jgi:ABC-type methionine transport system ATPase subunit
MSDQIVRLVYPPALLSVPIINQLIRRYDLTVNILRAQIGGEDRWIEVQLAGNAAVIEDAINWLETIGIEVQKHIA